MSDTDSEPRERRWLVQKPIPLQYFYKGQLIKQSEKERVGGRFELFLDLLYVALVANFAEHLADDPSGVNLVIYLITFTPAWHAWADIKENANKYYNDDLLQRVAILWVMAVLIVYGNNANFVGDSLAAQRVTVGAYLVIRFTLLAFYALYSVANTLHRAQNHTYCALGIVSLLLWVPIFFESVSARAKIAVAVIAMAWEQFAYVVSFGPWLTRWLRLDYQTAADIDHETDRYTAFTIIVLGEFTYALLVGSPAAGGLNLALLRAVWTLVIAFCFNSIYVYADGAVAAEHPIRRSVVTAFLWLVVHLPMSAGLLIGGHVSAAATSNADGLTPGQRWLWGGGLGVGMLCMWIIAQLYRDLDGPGKLALGKQKRLAARLCGAIVYALLPLASEEQLSTTSLVSVGAAVSVFVVLWETVGGLQCDAGAFEPWFGARAAPMPAGLTTQISRKRTAHELTGSEEA